MTAGILSSHNSLISQPTTRCPAAIYCRVSTGAQETEGTSLDSQEEQSRCYAAQQGYTVAEEHVYREVFTGTELWDRPRLTVLREAVRGGQVGAVIVYATDRLARDPIHLAIVAEECDRHGVALLFVSEPLDSSPEGALIRYVKGYAAKIEHEKIRERTLRGKRQRAEAGQLHNYGVDLYGYRRDKESRTRRIEEGEAAVVRQIFHWVAVERLPFNTILRLLNHRGIPSPAAGKRTYANTDRTTRWGRSALSRILGNPAYKGETYAWRYRSSKTFRGLTRPEDDWIRLPDGVTPPIVSPELWDAAQQRCANNSAVAAATRNRARPYLLRGLIFCNVCGKRMRTSPEHNGRVYRCSSRETAGGACGGHRVPADDVEAWAWAEIAAILKDPGIIFAEAKRQRERGPDPALLADLETAKRSLARLTKQQERLVRRLREADDDTFPWELIEREIASIEREKRDVQATVTAIEGRLARQQEASAQLDALADYCATVASNVDEMTFDEQRLALEALAIRIDANGGKKVRDWHGYGELPLTGEGIVFHASKCYVNLMPRPPSRA